jgi:hypothetical protein
MNPLDKDNELILVTDENFEERAYLASNPDVARAVSTGILPSGKIHFEQFGRNEKRKVRVGDLSRPVLKPRTGIANTLLTPIKKGETFISGYGKKPTKSLLQRGISPETSIPCKRIY